MSVTSNCDCSCENEEGVQERIALQKKLVIKELQHDWHIESTVPPVETGDMPELPAIPPYDWPVEKARERNPENTKALIDRIVFLTSHYPDKNMANEIIKLIHNESMMIEFRTEGQFVRFSTRPLPSVQATKKPQDWHLYPLYPTLILNEFLLAKLQSNREVIGGILKFSREIEMYFQWHAATENQKKIFADIELADPLTRKDCEYIWYIQHYTSFQQCFYAHQWGMPDLFESGFCRHAASAPALNQALLFRFVEVANEHPCLFTWAQIVFHPHPEAFLPDFDPSPSLLKTNK